MEKEEKKWGGAREGSGRNTLYKGEKKARVHLYLTEKAAEILNESAEEAGLSRSDYLNKLLLGIKGNKE